MGTTTEDSNKHPHRTRETSGHVTKEAVTSLTLSHRRQDFNGKYKTRNGARHFFTVTNTPRSFNIPDRQQLFS